MEHDKTGVKIVLSDMDLTVFVAILDFVPIESVYHHQWCVNGSISPQRLESRLEQSDGTANRERLEL